MPLPPIALQMYTLRDLTRSDFAGTVKSVANIGYQGIELAGFPDMKANAFKALVGDLGLRIAGAHIGIQILEGDLDGALDYCNEIGCADIACPFLPPQRRTSGDDYRQVGASLQDIGRKCRERGVQLSYHNHDFELQRFEGETGLDLLFKSSDPSLVQWESDVYWVEFAGLNAASLIQQYSGRCPFIHLKDMTKDDSRTFAEVGEGRLDFRPVFEAGDRGGARWYIVEQDVCQRPPLESVAISLRHLQEWGRA